MASLFEPDVLLPVQYLASLQRSQIDEAERRLMLAVLANAVDCYRKHALARESRSRTYFRETEEWFVSDDTSWPFAFESICDVLGMDAEHVRMGLDRWRWAAAPTAACESDDESGTADRAMAPVTMRRATRGAVIRVRA